MSRGCGREARTCARRDAPGSRSAGAGFPGPGLRSGAGDARRDQQFREVGMAGCCCQGAAARRAWGSAVNLGPGPSRAPGHRSTHEERVCRRDAPSRAAAQTGNRLGRPRNSGKRTALRCARAAKPSPQKRAARWSAFADLHPHGRAIGTPITPLQAPSTRAAVRLDARPLPCAIGCGAWRLPRPCVERCTGLRRGSPSTAPDHHPAAAAPCPAGCALVAHHAAQGVVHAR